MWDHVTEELISAYLDGELTEDERNLVERRLAESDEHRQLLEQMRAGRAGLKSLPRFGTPADFGAQVLARIQASPPDTPDPVVPEKRPQPVVPGERIRSRTARAWWRLAVAAGSLAALVTFAVMLPPRPASDPAPPVTPVQLPVYLRKPPTRYVMVYDVSVTPKGQRERTVTSLLQSLEISFDPALALDKKLTDDLVALQISQQNPNVAEAVPYDQAAGVPKGGERDVLDMMYVPGVGKKLDQFGQELEALEAGGDLISQVDYAMVLEPQAIRVMRDLHQSARAQFASNPPSHYSEEAHAFQLSFRIRLTGAGVPGVASLPTASLEAQLKKAVDAGATARVPDGSSGNTMVVTDDSSSESDRISADAEVYHILVILRNLPDEANTAK